MSEPSKGGQNRAEVHQTRLKPATYHCPSSFQISSRSVKRCTRKTVTQTHPDKRDRQTDKKPVNHVSAYRASTTKWKCINSCVCRVTGGSRDRRGSDGISGGHRVVVSGSSSSLPERRSTLFAPSLWLSPVLPRKQETWPVHRIGLVNWLKCLFLYLFAYVSIYYLRADRNSFWGHDSKLGPSGTLQGS